MKINQIPITVETVANYSIQNSTHHIKLSQIKISHILIIVEPVGD